MSPFFQLLSGSFGGAVVALVLKTYWDHSHRPILRAALLRQKGGYRSFRTAGGYQAKYLRLYVSNIGQSCVRSCTAYIVKATKSTGEMLFNEETSPLFWSNAGLEMDIPRGVSLYLDVCSLHAERKPALLDPAVPKEKNRFEKFFEDRAYYEITILVAAENAGSLERKVTFYFDPAQDDLTVQCDDDTHLEIAMTEPEKTGKTEDRLVRCIAVLSASFIAVMAAVVFLAAIWNVFFNLPERGAILKEHFGAIVGMPVAAAIAFLLVVVLRQTEGPIEFKGLGFEFKRASGQVAMWVVCFLAIAGAIKLLWQ